MVFWFRETLFPNSSMEMVNHHLYYPLSFLLVQKDQLRHEYETILLIR